MSRLPPSLPPSPFLYPIVDVELLEGRRVGDVVSVLVSEGVRLVQLRGKGVPDGQLVSLAAEAVAAARAGGAKLIVNDRPDVALLAGADGVHLGQDDLAPRDARRVLPDGALVGLSTHTLDQVRLSAAEPVDYVALGPIFPTASKSHPDPAVGTGVVAPARRLAGRPLVAIGGITAENAAEVVSSGADGLAVIAALMRAPDLRQALRQFGAALAQR